MKKILESYGYTVNNPSKESSHCTFKKSEKPPRRCITTAENIEEGMELIEDAKCEWIKAAIDSKYSIAEPNFLETYSGQFKLRIPKTLHTVYIY